MELSTGRVLSIDGLMIPCQAWSEADAMPAGRERDEALIKVHTRAVIQKRRISRLIRLDRAFVNNTPLQLGDIEYQTYPAQYDVTLYGKPAGRWFGDKIAQWFLDHEHPVPPRLWRYLRTNYISARK